MKEILDLALQQAQDAELFSVKVERYPVTFAGNELKSIKSQLGRSIGLRVNVNGKMGFSSDSNIEDREGLVKRAVETAPFGPDCPFEFNKSDEQADVQLFDPKTVTFEVEDGVEMGSEIIRKLKKAAPETYSDVKISKNFLEVTYMSGDVEKTYYKTIFSYSVTNIQVKDDGFIYIDEYDSSGKIPDNPLEIADRIIEKFPLVENVYEMPSKPMPVIFHPKAVDQLLRPLTTGLSGKSLMSGSSPMLGKLGEQILDRRFTLSDNGRLDFGSQSDAFDGEGLPRNDLKLFDGGVLKNYLLDMATATHMKMEPNGCADRGLDSPPGPSSSNLIISAGDTPYEDMLSGLEDGLIVEDVIGGGQSNLIAGEFSLNVSLGFRIQKGKPVGRVRNTMIAGNVYELLKDHILALGSKIHRVGSVFTPYILFRDLSVSGKG